MFLFNKKRSIAEFYFNYSRNFCHIDYVSDINIGINTDDLLVLSYITYLARYFYICDERQISPMKDFLDEIENSDITFPEICQTVQVEIFKTLTRSEIDAVLKLFNNMTPLYLTDNIKDIGKPNFKYTLEIYSKKDIIRHNFKMSVSPDKILLPLTVAHFYEFVMSKLSDDKSIKKLFKSMRNLSIYYENYDCRKIDSLAIAPDILKASSS